MIWLMGPLEHALTLTKTAIRDLLLVYGQRLMRRERSRIPTLFYAIVSHGGRLIQRFQRQEVERTGRMAVGLILGSILAKKRIDFIVFSNNQHARIFFSYEWAEAGQGVLKFVDKLY